MIGGIVGGSIGGVAVFAAIVYFWRWRRNRKVAISDSAAGDNQVSQAHAVVVDPLDAPTSKDVGISSSQDPDSKPQQAQLSSHLTTNGSPIFPAAVSGEVEGSSRKRPFNRGRAFLSLASMLNNKVAGLPLPEEGMFELVYGKSVIVSPFHLQSKGCGPDLSCMLVKGRND